MWAVRVVIGPFTENLPHAGGIGLSLIQSIADIVLFAALRRKSGSTLLALDVVLLTASSPFDLSLTATIWNPPLAVAFVKLSIACVLLGGERRDGLWWGIAATAFAVLALQSHSSAIFFAAPVAAAFTLRELAARRWSDAWRHTRATLETIAILQLPFLIHLVVDRPEGVGPSMVTGELQASLQDPARLQPAFAASQLSAALERILLEPATLAGFTVVLTVSLIVVLVRWRRDVPLVCATVAPLVLTIIGFSAWRRAFDTYWFMTLAPCAAVALGLALGAWDRVATAASAVLLAALLVAQPARVRASMAIHRLPEYGALLRSARAILERTDSVRSIETEFALPPTTDPTYLYRVLGGSIAADAPFSAYVAKSGEVVFRPASR
jgi:hypothetical protein